jgi:predicted transcriptional regulator
MKHLPMDEIVRKYNLGIDGNTLGREYGVHGMTIRNRLKEMGVLRSRRPNYCIETAKKLYEEGQTLLQVAKKLGVTEWAVNRDLKNLGVEMRDNRHPVRRELSRRMMAERIEKMGSIRVGKHEPAFCHMLEEKYGKVVPQYKIEKGGHHFDAYSNGILWELDEKEHQTHQDRISKNKRYDTRAKELGYEVRHVWEWDFFESGVERWHTLI